MIFELNESEESALLRPDNDGGGYQLFMNKLKNQYNSETKEITIDDADKETI